MTKKTHLEITDLPQDNLNVLYGVRKPLVQAFNMCREYPYKMTLLKNFLKFMYNQCVAFEKHLDTERSSVLNAYSEAGIDPDERKATDTLKSELPSLIAAKAA